MYAESRQLTALLPGAEDIAFARRLTADLSGAQRKWIRVGLSSAHSLDQVVAAAGTARLAAAGARGTHVVATAMTALIAIGAFWLSFIALRSLAITAGVPHSEAWLWPLRSSEIQPSARPFVSKVLGASWDHPQSEVGAL